MGVKLNRQQFADLIGKSPKWVGELIKRGLPAEGGGGRGTPVVIDSADGIAWIIDHEVKRQLGDAMAENMPQAGTMDGEELLLTMAKRRKAWVEADRAEESVIGKEDAAQFFYEVGTVFATELDGLGARHASELATINDPALIKHLLFTESRRIRAATAERLQRFAAEYPGKRNPDSERETAEDSSSLGG